MGTVNLLPTGVDFTRGTWTFVGAASLTAAVNDSSDASYVRLLNTVTTGQVGVSGADIAFDVDTSVLPTGARVFNVLAKIRAGKVTASGRTLQTRIDKNGYSAAQNNTWNHATACSLTSSPKDFTGSSKSTGVNGELLDQSAIDNLVVRVYGIFATDVRVYKMSVDVTYDERPTATITEPSGALDDTTSPLVKWDYLDDYQGQAAYEVEVYSGSTLVYASGTVTSSEPSHQIAAKLANGAYTTRVRVAQQWSGPEGTFWGDWTAGTSFSISIIGLSKPDLNLTDDAANGRLIVGAVSNQNMLSYSAAGYEFGASMWSVSNATIAASAGVQRSGGSAGNMNVTSGGGGITSYEYIPVRANVHYHLSAYVKRMTGSANVTIKVQYYDAAYATSGALQTIATTAVTTAYTRVHGSMPAPTVDGYAKVSIVSDTTGVHVVDDINVYLEYDPAFSASAVYAGPTEAVDTMRGGLLFQTPNLLSWDEASIEDSTLTNWTPAGSATLEVLSATQAVHGGRSLRVTRTGSTGTAQVDLCATSGLTISSASTLRYFSVNPSEVVYVNASVFANTTTRTATITVSWYDASLVFISSSTVSGSDATGAWTALSGNMTAPVTAAYMTLSLSLASVVAGELHYWDRISVVRASANADGLWHEGYFLVENSLVIEYSEDQETWYDFATLAVDEAVSELQLFDYDLRSDTPRYYRCFFVSMVDGSTIVSDVSTPESESITLTHSWLHAESDAEGTALQFIYDGTGRSASYDTAPASLTVDGRDFPIVEFGENRGQAIDFTAQIPWSDTDERAAAEVLLRSQGMLVFRDQRGRRGRGYLTAQRLPDVKWGNEVAFTFNYAGDQPWLT